MNIYQPRRSARATAGVQLQLTPLARPNPFVIAWRWRWELLLTGTLAIILILGDRTSGQAGLIGAAALVAILAALAFAWPASRRFAMARSWVIITQHRIRSACAHSWIQTRNGKLPAIAWTSAEPYGERVWIWCKSGVSLSDFLSAREQIAAACWARSVEIGRSDRHAHIVFVDVIRRSDPLGPSEVQALRDEPWTGTPWPSPNGHRAWPGADAEARQTRPEPVPTHEGDHRDAA